jgi:hypothetical protein
MQSLERVSRYTVAMVCEILQGYTIFCAGTGYGNSLIFEGLAVLGGKEKLVIVISPLKALECDQVHLLTSLSSYYCHDCLYALSQTVLSYIVTYCDLKAPFLNRY